MTEKGILGMKKDPNNLMLFSFNVREGEEWPSDDSNDESYRPQPAMAERLPTVIAERPQPAVFERPTTTVAEAHSSTSPNGSKKKKKSRKKSGVTASDNGSSGDETVIYDSLNTTTGSGITLKITKRQNSGGSKTKNKSGKRRKSDQNKEENHVEYVGDNKWGEKLPEEILLQILKICVRLQGPLPFLCRAAKVCRLWHTASNAPVLWSKLDLSYGWIKSTDRTLKWLCENRFSNLKDVSFTSWKTFNNASIDLLTRHCPQLEGVGLSHCTKVNSQGIKTIVDSCPKLASVDFSFMAPDAVSSQCLKNMIEQRGATLKSINFSGNVLKSFNSVFNLICSSCPLLELLDLSNASFSTDFLTIDVESFQENCPSLKVLRLTNSKFRTTNATAVQRAESPGFPALEELSVATTPDGIRMGTGVDDTFLYRLLKMSTKLRLLDLRGCSNITCDGVQQLPMTDLEQLYISQSSIAKYNGLHMLLWKWQHSLREVDMSWNLYPDDTLDSAMDRLADNPEASKLEVINLSGTSISCSKVKSLLEGCPRLRSINLVSCRGLPRGMKRDYNKIEVLDQLRKDIDKFNADDS